ncbi:dethiobiotin synthase [Cognatishimia maritima]|uniref:ATP-dependent dethiobiotin synthetase BioD n=1 Tax=Cognatishimia maritima TaxID=870908 RepID=A0A1M5MYL5_9RHOB|nr:dethiobiotin synthase [Cognatishimia maritima]SHG82371.1 dethiobiotin synthetase [Cognatishimia maritima]
MSRVVVVGTDTDIGKTIFAAGLTKALGATYLKPVQSGLEGETDSQTVARLSGQPVLPELVRLKLPASPHISAEAEGRKIDPSELTLPDSTGPLVIEGAGGLLVPINRELLYLDLISAWQYPVVLCARTRLGTINHSLLSVRALKAAGCPVIGIAFIGDAEPEVEQTIVDFGETNHLGCLPILNPLTPETLADAFQAIDIVSIREAMT